MIKEAWRYYGMLLKLGHSRDYAKDRALALLRSKRATAATKLDALLRGGQI
jgi:hypothetical protein